MWEASVSIGGGRGPYPIPTVTARQGTACVDHVLALLEGVGDDAEAWWHVDSVSVHQRRKLAAEEMGRLPDGWLACPAVDRGGSEDRMRRDPPWPPTVAGG